MLDRTREDIGYGRYCHCGRLLIGDEEKKSGVCGFCYKPEVQATQY